MRALKVALFVVLFFLLNFNTVFAAEWYQDAGNAQRTGFTIEEPAEPWTFAWSWNGSDASGGTGNHIYNAPREARTVMGGGKLYVPTGTRGLYGLNNQTGQQQWNVTTTAFNATPAYDPTTQSIFAVGADGKVYKISSTGTVSQTFTAGSPINKAVLLNGGFVYVVTDSGQLYKLSTANLSPAWATPYAAGSTSGTPPAFSQAKNLIVFATDDLYVHAVNDADGTRKWRVKPSPNAPSGTAQQTASGAYLGNQFDMGWPVIAEQHGTVFVRMQLTHQAHFEGLNGGRFGSTNAESRTWLSQNPQWKNLFALNLDTGAEKFIPAVGYGSTEDFLVSQGITNGVMGSMPVVKLLPDGKEVAYIHFRSNQTDPPSDFRWSGHMGEMALDDTTISGLVAGDLRFIKMSKHQAAPAKGNCDVHIVDEQTPLTVAGDTLINAHWAASCSVKITDRSSTKGLTAANPIVTTTHPPFMRAQRASCSDKNVTTHFTTCNAQFVTDGGSTGEGRFFGGPGFWSYWGVADPPGWRVGSNNTAGTSYSAGFQGRYTYVANGLMIVQGNGGDIIALRHSGPITSPRPVPSTSSQPSIRPTPRPSPAGDMNNDGMITAADLKALLTNFLQTGLGDLNADGKINIFDATYILMQL